MNTRDPDAPENNLRHSTQQSNVLSFFEPYYRKESRKLQQQALQKLEAGQVVGGERIKSQAELHSDPVYKAVHRHVRRKKSRKVRRIRSKTIRRLVHNQGRLCFYCGTTMTLRAERPNSATLDHIMPVSQGGPSNEFNYVAACRTCNQVKADMHIVDFINLMRRKFLLTLEVASLKLKEGKEHPEPAEDMSKSLLHTISNIPPLFLYSLAHYSEYTKTRPSFLQTNEQKKPARVTAVTPEEADQPLKTLLDQHIQLTAEVEGTPADSFAVAVSPGPTGTRISFTIPEGTSQVQVTVRPSAKHSPK